ncbi:MarR family winged helix-turn-helix transcriptional regulator [Devosia psychrophila]|uniref:Transcriptional regulator n=1 Tax=Devosia psychrophila TaxID=728005 RepID=A0A0F5PVX1_9HYPH|nr:MarR family transcriptional regulator [Devosia psychrophila]KKC32531.1 transcriptional regulator [Devosia psychrophila]SFD26219.1 DNA-binding transcriptional regulator, MarR family [Devosia psychrophila]
MTEHSRVWIDAETKIADAPGDHHDELRLWLRLFSVTRLMENDVRSRLQNEFDVTFPRFDILSQLYRVPDGLILGELSQRLMVSPGNITSVIKRLMDDGMIVRNQNPNDRRENIVQMTTLGREKFIQMAASNEEWVRNLTKDLAPADVKALLALLQKMKTSVRRALDE